MTKTLLIFLLFTCFSISVATAQVAEGKINKSSLGITFSSFGSNDVLNFQQMEGAASYNGDKFYTLGFAYQYRLNKHLYLETNRKVIPGEQAFPGLIDTNYRVIGA